MKDYILLIVLFWTCVMMALISCNPHEDSNTKEYINCDCKCAKEIFMQDCAIHQPAKQCRSNWEDIRGDAFNCAIPSLTVEKESNVIRVSTHETYIHRRRMDIPW
jgi:hypothetical protein